MSGKKLRSHCPINFGLETFGDKWTLLILRDIVFRGKSTYGELLKSEEGFATNILATRLMNLEDDGILEKEVDLEDARRSRYRLTDKGVDLLPLIFEMMIWSLKHDAKSEARRTTRLLGLVEKQGRPFIKKVQSTLRKGQPLFPEYLDK